jgi:hypothetical protein
MNKYKFEEIKEYMQVISITHRNKRHFKQKRAILKQEVTKAHRDGMAIYT